MSSTGIVSAGGNGRGPRFPRLASVFIARSTVLAGGVYIMCENNGASPDSAAVTVSNSNADNGTLANAIAVGTNAAAGMVTATSGGGELAVLILATEAAATGAPFIGLLEGYYVDALVTTAGSGVPRKPLYPRTTGVLQDVGSNVGSPAHGRLLQDVGTITATLTKVHFCGLPGGFSVGPGT